MQIDRKGYPWFFLDPGKPWKNTLIVTMLLVVLALGSFILYQRMSPDPTPDSIGGYTYAILATLCMILASILYTRRRRSRKRQVGELNTSLHWHVTLGILALVFAFLHSFGNFNPRTGTYALYGMISLVLSGVIGRILDRMVPRMIANAASKALTEYGDDRIEYISDSVQQLVTHNSQGLQTIAKTKTPVKQQKRQVNPVTLGNPVSTGGSSLPESWDIAYISLSETPQEANRDAQQYRFVPDRKSPLNTPGALLPGVNDHITELKIVQQAMQREQFYRAIVRYWRFVHVALVIITIGLVLWHLEFAFSLLIPVFLHH
ncbi:MAG TPA: hypothetical protein VL461_04885 [Dictyobacter sp.]|jgi:hypothetical protein|nr:hypothetical protein [Dictyobacter sp.]